MIEIEIDRRDLDRAAVRFLTELAQGAQRATKDEAEATRERIASGLYWTNRTGKTGQSFKVEPGVESLSSTLASGSKVARFLLNGTPPHVIQARRRDALAFVVNGTQVFRRRVNHPGTKARPYLQTEATRAEPALMRRVESAANAAVSSTGFD